MQAALLATLAALAAAATARGAACGATLLATDFNSATSGALTKDLAKDLFATPGSTSWVGSDRTGPGGLVFLKSSSQGELGGGVLESLLPKGALPCFSGVFFCGAPT